MRKKKLWKRILALGLCITLTAGLPGETYGARNVSTEVAQDETESTENTGNVEVSENTSGTVEKEKKKVETETVVTEVQETESETETEKTEKVEETEKSEETEQPEEIETEETEESLNTKSDSDQEYGEFKYTVNGDNVTITGYTGAGGRVVVPQEIDGKTVTAIGDSAFSNCSGLETIKFNSGLQSIGSEAFSGCNNLQNINLPESLTTIGCGVFTSPYITSITIPKNVVSMGEGYRVGYSTFSGCKNLETVIFEEGMTKIPDVALYYCENVKNIVIPDGVTIIGNRALRKTAIEILKLPETLEVIEDNAVWECSALKKVIMSNNVRSIGSEAFSGCNNLQNINLPESLTTIGCGVFTSPYITSITIPKNVVSMGEGYRVGYSTFSGCKNLETVIFEEGMTKIPDVALYYCENVKNIVIPDGVTIIGNRALRKTAIEILKLPETLEVIEDNAVWECSALKKVIMSNNVRSIGSEAFAGCINMTIYGYSDSYAEAYATENNIPFKNYNLYTDDIASNAYGITENTRTRAGNVYHEIQCYNKAVNEYYSIVKSKFKTDYQEAGQKPKNFKELRKYDETASSRKTNQLLTIEAGAPSEAVDDAYEVLYDFLKQCMQTGVDEQLIKLDIDTSQSSVEIQAKVINKIYDAILEDSGSITGRGSNGYTVEMRKTGIFGQAFGNVTISGGKKKYGNYTGVFCSDGKTVSAAMNQFVDDLSSEVRKLYKEAALSLWKDFMKKSELGSITEEMLKSYLGDKTDYLIQKGYGNLLTSMLNVKKGIDLVKKISSAKTSAAALKQIQSADMEEIYKQITKLDYTDKELKDETVSQAMKKVESAGKNLESAVFDYLYNEDTYSNMNAGQKFKYFWKSVFQCPVDVEVYDESGNLVGSVIDGVVSYDDSIYIELDGDVKTVYVPQNMKVTYKLTGTDDGVMNYVLEEYSDGAATGRLNYYDVPLVKGVQYEQMIEEKNISGTIEDAPLIDADGNKINADEYINAQNDNAVVQIDVTVEDGGNVFGTGNYAKGDSVELTAVADSGYQFEGWYQNDILIDTHSNYIFTAVANQSLTARFSKPSVMSEKFMVEMAEAYKDNARIAMYDKSDSTADIVISLYDSEDTNDITVMAISQDQNGNEISKEKVTAICDGTFHFSVNDYETDNWDALQLCDEEENLIGTVYKDGQQEFIISASSQVGGTITPSGDITVVEGSTQSFKIAAAEGYEIADVKVDGESIGAVDSYEFKNVTENHSIEALFSKKSGDVVNKKQQILTGTTAYQKKVKDQIFDLNAKIAEGDGTLSYTSSNTSVVRVDNTGTVMIFGTGTAVITVMASETEEYSAARMEVNITVSENDTETPDNTANTKLKAIRLDADALILKKGKSRTLTAKLEPAGVQNISLVWTSSAPDVIAVDNRGRLTAKANGQAVITVAVQGKETMKAHCQVTVPYNIIYKLNKGTNDSKNPNSYYNQKITLKNPKRKGYSFRGWYADKKYKNKVSTIKKGTKKDFTLYAKWQKIKVAKVNLTSVKNNKAGQVQVKYKKVSGVKGYEISYSKDAKFKKQVIKKTTKQTSYTVKKLKKKKTYYVRIRAYSVDSTGKKVYGKYSVVKKVKIAK